MKDCFTCEYAHRDKHNRFVDRCSGFGNCDYSEFEGKIKPSLKEYLDRIYNDMIKSDMNIDYKNGFCIAIGFIDEWETTE